ncbi:MAG: hypothetical protein IKT40_06270 [Bacilli bacterium]|nr:hypothetical protein [Bacilli bacterium]
MFDIRFYICKDKENIINKTKTSEIVKRGTLKEPSSIYNPTITIKNDSDIITKNYNYVEIPRFNRFYFIEDIVISDAFSIISLRCDVLESFKDDILNSTQIIGRQENAFDLDIVDNEIVVKPNKIFQVKLFPNSPFETDNVQSDDFIYTLTTGSLQSKMLTE